MNIINRGELMQRLRNVIKKFISPQGNLFRYSSSFCFLLALLPGLIIILKTFQNEILNNPGLISFLYGYVPEKLLAPFIQYILSREYNTYLSMIISLSLSIYLASNVCYSFMLISMNDEGFSTYGILIRVKAIFMFILLVIGLIILALLNYFINGIIVIIFGLLVFFYLFYRFLSFEKKPKRYGIIGSVFASCGIMIIGITFIYYVEHYTRYDILYGPLASLVILLISIYLVSSVIYFGYCLNQEFSKSCFKGCYKHMWYYNWGNKIIKKVLEKFKSIA